MPAEKGVIKRASMRIVNCRNDNRERHVLHAKNAHWPFSHGVLSSAAYWRQIMLKPINIESLCVYNKNANSHELVSLRINTVHTFCVLAHCLYLSFSSGVHIIQSPCTLRALGSKTPRKKSEYPRTTDGPQKQYFSFF
jgi:hypothetical protein